MPSKSYSKSCDNHVPGTQEVLEAPTQELCRVAQCLYLKVVRFCLGGKNIGKQPQGDWGAFRPKERDGSVTDKLSHDS